MTREDSRVERLAENEAIFRAGNERIRAVVGEALPRTPYMCECGDERCLERIELTQEEYERVRERPTRFFVLPGHEDLTAGERVAERFDQYVVVEKEGKGREIVTRTHQGRG